MFIAALFTIAKIWKNSSCPSIDEWIKTVWYIYTVEYYSAVKKRKEKKRNLIFWDSMDGPGDYCAKWKKPVRGKQIPYDLTYM